jgi:hypothetical protein
MTVLCFCFLVVLSSGLSAQKVEPKTSLISVNKFVKWLKAHRDEETGLPYSHVGDKRFDQWSFTYDSAVVALAYMAVGDINDARKIIDFYMKAPEVKRLNGFIEAFIPSSSTIKGQDYSVRTGANVWMGIAGLHLYKKTKELKYFRFAKKIAGFAIALQDKNSSSKNFGGIALGPVGDSAYKGDQHIAYDPKLPAFSEIYSTEINIDAYSLFNQLYKERKDQRYGEARDSVLRWLKKNAYNSVDHRFNRGYDDSSVATDVQSWSISALGVEILHQFEKNAAERVIAFVEDNCITEDVFRKPDGRIVKVKGVDFVDHSRAKSLNRKPLVSPEWTFQLTNAYLKLSQHYSIKGNRSKSVEYKNKREKMIKEMLKLAINLDGALAYPYATQAEAELGHENATPRKGNLSVVGVAYGILALKNFDPLVP